MEIKQTNVFKETFTVKSTNDTPKLAIISDVHFDSVSCNREKLKKDLDYFKKIGAKIFIHGDFFDVMGTHKDPRSKPQDIRPEYFKKGKGYLDIIVQDAAEFLKPYAENILLITDGNHETVILKNHDVNILDRLCFILRQTTNSEVQHSGYSGYVLFNFIYHASELRQIYYWHHGYGGNAKRSKSILNSQMDAMYVSDADILVSGHDHNNLYDPSNARMYLDTRNGTYRIKYKFPDWIKIGSYKNSNPEGGWATEKGMQAKLLGGWIIEFHLTSKRAKREPRELLIKRKIYSTKFL